MTAIGNHSSRRMALAALVLTVGVFFAISPLAIARWSWRPADAWAVTIAAGLAVLFAIGRVAGQHVLVDDRQRWSLSRLQLLAWTVLLLPSIWTMVIVRMLAHANDPMALGMDENMWALLGISAASFVGSPLILERKRTSPGLLDVAAVSEDGSTPAGVRDLFRGEQTGNADLVDIARVQMCLLTAVAVAVYFVACWRAFAGEPATALAFPPMSQNLVVLIGISHATYLAAKVPDHPAGPAGRRPVSNG
jgi:hypothetical protein